MAGSRSIIENGANKELSAGTTVEQDLLEA